MKDRRVVLRRLEVSRGGTLDQVQRTAGDVVDTAGSAPIPAGLNPEGFFADELRARPARGRGGLRSQRARRLQPSRHCPGTVQARDVDGCLH